MAETCPNHDVTRTYVDWIVWRNGMEYNLKTLLTGLEPALGRVLLRSGPSLLTLLLICFNLITETNDNIKRVF
jgi:hypothetical protein